MTIDSMNIKTAIENLPPEYDCSYYETKLNNYYEILNSNLDFHGKSTNYNSHNFHAFAAKFPPQIPRIFMENLTQESDTVLDPLVGSGTTLVEAVLLDRNAIGVDLDPLSQLICKTKISRIPQASAQNTLSEILNYMNFHLEPKKPEKWIREHFDEKTKEFIDFWFEKKTQLELATLMCSIEEVASDENMKNLFLGIFSSIIITKAGGVSKARDLAHTRPHRDLKKKPRNAINQFRIKAEKSIKALSSMEKARGKAKIIPGDARNLPLSNNSIDLIITSPPYVNGIDYMRAHKFSLVWFGWPIDRLSHLRSRYIGSEKLRNIRDTLPVVTSGWCEKLEDKDARKGKILRQYYCDMSAVICEMYRVLRDGTAAITIVGTSTMRGIVIPHHLCLKEIAAHTGFKCIKIGERALERNKRMMPIAHKSSRNGIENRLHCEYILGLWKE